MPVRVDPEAVDQSGRRSIGLRVTTAAGDRGRHGVEVGDRPGLDVSTRCGSKLIGAGCLMRYGHAALTMTASASAFTHAANIGAGTIAGSASSVS